MSRVTRKGGVLAIAFALMLPLGTLGALEAQLTEPGDFLGFDIGDDYRLANYQQLHEYWRTLAAQSPRMVLDTIGTTSEGRSQIMAIITSPENHADLDRYKAISRRMATAEGVSEAEARALASEGKAVVWIDGGLHATEVLGAQQLMELVWQMVSREDDETLRFLDDVILLAVHANPDGMDLVADWYMRNADPMERSTSGIPVLYNKYAGHDNNRDFYMSNLAETTNMNRVAYREWFPQIIYNHHQTGPTGTIMFAPPFRDPPNHNLDPLIITSLDQVGSSIHHRMVQEGKGGTTMRSGASYSTWWNGGLRTTPYFKNMIGLLTETIGNPTPLEVPFLPEMQISRADLPLPVEPGVWHFRQSIDYSQTSNRAVLDYASRNDDKLLFNIWRMGTNSIERGSRDYWTVLPKEIVTATEALPVRRTRRRSVAMGDQADLVRMLRDPAERDARGYVIPSDQPDFLTATKFVNSLLKNGVSVHRATDNFTVAGRGYPAGSYVVKADQAFRPHVLDMFEAQDHPNDFAYPGAPPTAPYDNAGWTLAYQMNVEFDRILDGFEGPFEAIEWLAEPPTGRVDGPPNASGYLLSHQVNDAMIAVNRLLGGGHEVYWMTGAVSVGDEAWPAGTFYIPAESGVRAKLDGLASEIGLSFRGVPTQPAGEALELEPIKIGLWDRYGGSMPSGWTRMMLEDFEFDFEVVYASELDRGNLNDRFDVLVFEDGGIPAVDDGSDDFRRNDDPDPMSLPEEYRNRVGSVTPEVTIPQIRAFLEEGGAVVAIGSSTSLGYHLGLGVTNHLLDDEGDPLSSEVYYTPGSVLDMRVDHTSPVAQGLGDRADVLFSHSPVFDIDAEATGVRRIGWFDTDDPLRSGWAWGQEYLRGGVTMLEADVGEGKLFLFGPKITFRGQAHGTLPLLFNGMYYGTARVTRLGLTP